MLSLVMNPGLPEEQTMVLAPGTVTVGRTKDNHIVCMHKSLSRKHAQLDFDGTKVRVTDLQSKNGVFFNGQRVATCNLVEGDSFRCGDITFLLEGATTQAPKISVGVQTLPSPLGLGLDSSLSKRVTKVPPPAVLVEDDQRYKDKLFLLIRASELLVGELPLEKVLDELVVLAVQVLDVDRITLLTLDEKSLEMKPKVIKTFVGAAPRPYSKRVIDWVVDNGSPTSFSDVSSDKSLLGDAKQDAQIKGAMAVPINPGGGTIGVLYADSISRTDAFRADDLALFRALANFAAIAMDSHALRRNNGAGASGGSDL
ncbi:MAG TPA: FHA domain-containing protein, partial [Labilithrix sp.]|nr:FHA domain-containing protein [Labilithrix sp.]